MQSDWSYTLILQRSRSNVLTQIYEGRSDTLGTDIVILSDLFISDLIRRDVLNKCKKGVRIINVARGGIISETDLLDALESGQCGGAALDVFEQEPPKDAITLKLIQHDKVVATPHLGASTSEAQVRVAVEISEQIIALTGKSKEYTTTPGVVNRSVLNKFKI